MSVGILFAISAAIVFGLWTVFHNQAAEHISPVLGAILVSLTAVIIGLPFFIREWVGVGIQIGQRGFFFIVLTGISAFTLDYLVLRTYSAGIPISIGGPIIIGGSIAVAVIIGFFLGEQITIIKTLGITLVLIGAAILASFV
ncbi:EamA family transporter [Candidatus Kaiserbacteria bacterium]|nr:EamA family transporter [Candidatus Kaiserbacteria bacterium]